MATFGFNAIAAIACLLLTLGQASSVCRDWPFCSSYGPRRNAPFFSDLSARDWLYPGLGQNLHDYSLDSNDWISAINKLFPDINKNINVDETQFQVKVSMVGFTKDEVSVRVKDGFVVITGKHEAPSDDKAIVIDTECGYKQFIYKYSLPEDTLVEEMKSRLTSEGMLIVSAPRSGVKKVDTGYQVPVQTDEDNAVTTPKKHNEFYDEDSAETTTRAAAEEEQKGSDSTYEFKPIISVDNDGDYVKYNFKNV